MKTQHDQHAGAEVEVTEQMLEAGVSSYCEHDLRYERLSDVLRHVFEAMRATQRSPSTREVMALDLEG